jgi:hypothetical protein
MKPKRNLSLYFRQLALAFAFLPMGIFAQEADDLPSPGTVERVYELRIYYPNEGRLDDILKRFREHTTALFEKHGFTNVAYWVTRPNESPSYATNVLAKNEGKEALLYIISFPDMESRNRSWEAFIKDPEWIRVYEESRVNGPLVREIDQIFLDPTDFSNLK